VHESQEASRKQIQTWRFALSEHCLFHENEAKLFDFDFAHLRNYPVNWNTHFLERRPASASPCKSKQSHDVHAVIAITCHYFELTEVKGNICNVFIKEKLPIDIDSECAFTTEDHPELNEEWKNAEIEDLQTWLTENRDKLRLRQASDSEPRTTRKPVRLNGAPASHHCLARNIVPYD
jgi:hypothetical protein